MHYLLIAINNSTSANGKGNKDNKYLLLDSSNKKPTSKQLLASFVIINTADVPLNVYYQ